MMIRTGRSGRGRWAAAAATPTAGATAAPGGAAGTAAPGGAAAAATLGGRWVAPDRAGHVGGELRVERHPLHRVLGQRPVIDRRELLRLERERPLHVRAPDRGRDVSAERRVAVQVRERDLALGVAHPDAGRQVGGIAAEPGVLVVVGGAGLSGLDAAVGELRRGGGGAAADRP